MNNFELLSIARSIGVAVQDIEERHSAVQNALRFFVYEHLQHGLPRKVSAMFATLAGDLIRVIRTDDPELTRSLGRLLEAKDAAVRAAIIAVRETGDDGR